ncbi:uncharacterized protein SETTUDRAFT_44421 [Exserohilum turcica Et28A]|uniref:Uncharacterized protein n=1 Tax=Exserohilum turcicum (strain 28A) TaxID=671987 RepID=R0I7W6_EXST2|nr:uncharacterized protein SETTUDRAFT_44421 [Exserohilum turcica Et28A]EOA81531.1 hypothetical protein SETTUDRAFT_44421 [Exserohilum turcica Et28A]
MYGHRPHSFHAQDTWTYYPGASPPALNEYLNITNARQQFPQTRLGILPWPAKRASPSRGRDTELHVPPVPPIPNEVAVKHYRRRSSQDHASQRMLQGVGRHSSPSTARNRHSMPAMMAKESMVFPESAVFDSGTRAGAAERAQDYQALLLGVPKGAFFELELPTSAAESENRHKHGFRVGTAAAAADGGGGGGLTKAKENIDATNYDDNDDDDDQPPKLNLGPLPAGTTLGGGHAVVTDIYMDVSDEDTDDGACRGRHMAKLRAERTRSMTDTSVVTVQPQARWSTEAEMVVADDASYTSHPCSDDCANHEAAVRPQQTAADGALSPVWFASNDLRHGWTARPEIDHDADSRGAGEIGIGACGQQAWPATRTDGDISLRPELAGAAVQVQVEADTDASQARRVPARPADTTTTTASPSTASWPLGDSTTPPLYLYGAHPLSEMSEASSVATPVAPVPRMPRSEPEAPEAGPWLHGDGSHSDDGSHSADEPGGQAHLDESLPHLKPHALQPQAPHATTMAVPSRSTSILSQISAMVPEANKAPYAHASNGTSTPSAARRARPEFSKKLPAPPAQIPEEILASHDSGTAQGEDGDDDDDDDDDDFDLYADHNGIVKDVCDENGRPLRVAEATHSTPDAGLVRASHDGEPPRYSTERPMSFIAGPADQDGKPQDQINQSALPANDKFRPRQLETIYSELPGNSPEPQWDHVQPPPASISPPPSSPPPKNVLRAARSGDATKPAKQAPVEQTNSEKLNSQVSLPEELDAHEQVSQNVHVLNQDLHQPQPQRAQPILQGIFRGQSPSPVPQAQGPEQVPRNQYELHQQMLQQASNARLQSVDKQPSVSPEPPSADEALKPNGKPSAKNSASSMFKIFGGKSAGQLQHTKTPNAPVDPTPAGETAETANSVALPNHSTTEQKPCAVQISPPLDQKKHGTPAKFHRISLQQTRTGTSIKSMPYETLCAQSQPEVKKKRFAHLGSFFQKGSGGGDSVTAKPKHSKEDKKAQKALQKASAGSGESPIWNWDCRKPRYSNKESDQPSTSGNPLPNNVQVQQLRQTQKSALGIRPDEGSAFLSTKQLAAEHQAQKAGNNSHSGSATQGPSALIGRLRQKNQDPPLAEYYKPISGHAEEEQGAYAATTAVIQQQEHPIQRIRLREPQSRPQSELIFSQSWLSQREQMEQGQLVHGRPEQPSSNGQGMLQQIQPHQKHLPPHLRLGKLHPPSTPSIGSGLSFEYNPHDVMVSPAAPSGPSEPRYEATPIPAAYGHVSGAFVSPLEQQQQQPAYPSPGGQAPSALANRVGWQYGDAGMSLYTPQISAQSLMHPYHRTYSEASSISMATPMQESSAAHNSSPRPTTPRAHKPRMDSISEVQQQQYIQQQQQQQGRPWHLNFPAGATEQEIVRARQGQYMQELFHAQQQQQAERAAGSPSPGMPPPHVAPIVTTSHNHSPGGGFREILPRHPGQPYAAPHPALSHQEERFTGHHDPSYDQSAPAHPGAPPHPAAYPLPIVHHPTADPTARPSLAPLPPPKVPYTPTGPLPQDAQMDPINGQRHSQGHSITDHQYGAPHDRISHYEDQEHDEAPPSYDGIGVPNEGMDKNRPEAVRPPNINTNIDSQGQDQRPGLRPRQSSIGMLQHPQPASMAASPQRTLSDMGAESLRLQLLQQENLVQMERIQREQERRDAMMRERQEREAARARARELERSVSAGGQVGSLRSAGGSFRAPDWDRTGSQRPVFELPAVADEEEPVMKATSYPGQEWIPSFWDGE